MRLGVNGRFYSGFVTGACLATIYISVIGLYCRTDHYTLLHHLPQKPTSIRLERRSTLTTANDRV